MVFLFVAMGAAGIAVILRARGLLPLSAHSEAAGTIKPRSEASTPLVGNRGWLLVYMIGLAAQLVHSFALTIGSLVIYADPSLAGLGSSIPLRALVVYVVSNVFLLAYGVVLFALMKSKRRAAIANNILFNALSVAFLVTWFFLGAKSPVGTVVDSLPGLAAIAYFARSHRVRNTYTAVRPLS